MPLVVKPACSPLPWRPRRTPEAFGHSRVSNVLDANGKIVCTFVHAHVAALYTRQANDAAHIIACVNGSDARTQALAEALKETMRVLDAVTSGPASARALANGHSALDLL